MKKYLSVFVLLLLATAARAQKEVLFKIKIMPQQTYTANMTMDMDMEMNMIGDSSLINKAKQSGQAFPMLMKMQSASTTDIKTGAVNAQNEIPFSMSMKTLPGKMVMNGKETPVPVPATDQTFYGVYTGGVVPRIDSMGGKAMDATTRETIVKLIEGLQQNIKFPDKPMKIGDTFTQDVPLNLPIGGLAGKIVTKTTYTLTAITGDNAYFDLKYNIVMDVNGQTAAITMSGDGDGKFIYSIRAHYPVSMLNNMNMTYSMDMPQANNVKMIGKLKMVMNTKTDILAKK